MFDLEQLAAPVIPHLRAAGDVANQWGHAICARLDGIHLALLDEGIDEVRARISANLTPGGGRVVFAEMPVAEAWLFENWSVNLSVAGPFVIRADDEPVFAHSFAAGVLQANGIGNNLVVPGRSTLTIESPGAAAGRIYMQFQRRIPRPTEPRRFGGGEAPDIPSRRVLAPPNEHMPAYPLGKALTRQ